MLPPKPNPQNPTDWKEGFLFVANQLALDLVNSRLEIKDEPVELIPDFPSLLRWFRAAGLIGSHVAGRLEDRWGQSPQAEQAVAAIRQFRERLRDEILRWEAGRPIRAAALDEVNRLMAEHPMRTRLRVTDGQVAADTYFDPQRPEDLFAPIAHAAAMLFASTPAQRVRKCARCVAHFYDNSKKGNRRWCSMQICGNREKVAAYASRQRKKARR